MKNDVLFGMLLSLLARPRTARELADKYEMSERSVYRYLDVLEAAGVPLLRKSGPNGGYSLDSAHFVDKVYFSDAELNAAISAVRASAQALGDRAAESAADKLEGLAGIKADAGYALPPANLVIDTGSWFAPAQNEKIAAINAAIDACAVLRLVYIDADGGKTERDVEPHTLLLKDGAWYVYAYCRLRADWRLFRLSRIDACARTGESFCKRAYDAKALPWRSLPAADTVECTFRYTDKALTPVFEDLFGLRAVRDGLVTFRARPDRSSVAVLAPYADRIAILGPAEFAVAWDAFLSAAVAAK